MLNSRKGKLSCFQWEVERFQQNHREKMAAVVSQTNTRPATLQTRQRAGGSRNKDAKEKLAEIDVKKKNAWIIERMVQIHRVGGFQRRLLHEFQDAQASLQFGKANVGVSRAAREHRFIRRKKDRDIVRNENAKLFTRLASPNRSGIDFNKFEADFAKSREHRRIAQCNRTVGHTSVFSAVKARAPCSSADRTLSGPPPPTRENMLPTKEVQRRRKPTKLRSHSSSTPGEKKVLGRTVNQSRNPSGNRTQNGASCGPAPFRPHTAGGCRRPSSSERPHTALGLRRGTNHHDLFDARAADPGWGNGRPCPANDRPPSAPERRREGAEGFSVRRRRSPHSRLFADDKGSLAGAQRLQESAETQTGKGEGARGAGHLCLGRTLLVEAKVLIGAKKRSNGRGGGGGGGGGAGGQAKVGLRFLSLDGLIRQRKSVQKTLRGFVVEASLISPRRRTSPSFGGLPAESTEESRIGSTSVAISAVQDYLGKPELGGAGDGLESFREARPLDDRGNYQEIAALLGRVGQRTLYQMLLGSCRVITSGEGEGKVGVQLLQVNAGGAGVSVTSTPPSEDRAEDTEDGVIGNSAYAGASGGVAAEQEVGKKTPSKVVRLPPAQSAASPSPNTEFESGDEEQEDEGDENTGNDSDEDEVDESD